MSFWKNIFGDQRFKKRKSKSKKHEEAIESTETVSGVYKFKEKNRTYIGQSEDIAERLNQHLDDEKLEDENIDTVEIKEVEGDKLDREIEEQKEIDEYGVLPNQELSNKRNSMSKKRKEKFKKNLRNDE